jgi:phosphoglycolate phosphatase
MSYRHVVWDWNGTLLDDADACVRVMNGMLARRGLPPISVDFYRAVIEFPVILYYCKLGFDFSSTPFEEVSDEYVAGYQALWRACPLPKGTLEAMRALKDSGVGQSVLSASRSDYLEEQLSCFGLLGLLEGFTGADNHHGRGKLDLAAGHVGALGLRSEDVLFIGDTQHDAEVAREAGCDCLLVSFGHYSRERLESLNLPIADTMGEVLRYIQNGTV